MNLLGQDIYEHFAPMPEDLQGWNSHHTIFGELIKEIQPKTIIEVGTWKGASAINMGKEIKRLGMQTKIYCVDTWLGALEFWTRFKDTKERDLMLKNGYPQVYYQFLSNVVHNNLQDVIIPVPMPSTMAAQVLKEYNISAEIIYIDGSHEYEDVKSDIKNYLRLLNADGLMFGDDYGWPAVKRAVDECFKSYGITDNNYWTYRDNFHVEK